MASVIEICNLSLSAIGQGYINAIDEKSPQARACALHYDNARDAVLRQFPWNFATQIVKLAEVKQAIQGWNYVYQCPSNALWVRKVFGDGQINAEVPEQYEIVSIGNIKYIACDIHKAMAKITVRITDPELFDPLFVEVLAHKLALKIVMPLTNSSSKTQELQYNYQMAAANAKLAGAVEGAEKLPESKRPKPFGAYIQARR